MPYKDKSKQLEYLKSAYAATYSVKIKQDEKYLADALKQAANNENVSPTHYILDALREKLTRDGYI